jgi:hypothetical protein
MYYTNRQIIADFEQELSKKDGFEVVKSFDELSGRNWLKLTAKQVAFYEANPNASIEEVINCQLMPAPERTLEDAKAEKQDALSVYDTSEAVNSFIVNMGENKHPAWITAEQRALYMTSVTSAELIGDENIEIELLGQFVEMPVPTAKVLLAQIHRYADRAANTTARHKAAIEALATIEEVDEYDFTVGYPDKLIVPLS